MFDTGRVTASPSPRPIPGSTSDIISGPVPGSRSAVLRRLSEMIRPVTLATDRTLPVADPLAALLPDGGLARGSLVQVAGVGATSLGLALLAAGRAAGSWAAVIGLPELALVSADEHGVDLDRLVLIDVPRWRRGAEVVAATIDGIDLVLLDRRLRFTASEMRRITARGREQGSVLILVEPGLPDASPSESSGDWSPDLVLTLHSPRWSGLGSGHGVLRRRHVAIDAVGRGRASRPRHVELLLPDQRGSLAADPLEPSPDAVIPLSSREHRVAG